MHSVYHCRVPYFVSNLGRVVIVMFFRVRGPIQKRCAAPRASGGGGSTVAESGVLIKNI